MKQTFLFISGFFIILDSTMIRGCFITNCPPGGKRSGPSDTKIRQCEQCGPPGMNGLCYGPHICCSESEGCLVGTTETMTCSKENLLHRTPCQNPGNSCSGNDDTNPINGQCAAAGICCSTETCTMDDTCHNHNGGKEEESTMGQQKSGSGANNKAQNSHHFTTTHSGGGSIFQNPLDHWIPRRFSIGGGRPNGQRKPVRVIPPDISASENPFLDRILYPNDEY